MLWYLPRILKLDLMEYGCNWVQDYLQPFNDLLAYLHSAAQNPQDKNRLSTWLEILQQEDDHPDSIALNKTITDNCMSVVDLFDEFSSVQITLFECNLKYLKLWNQSILQKEAIYSFYTTHFIKTL